MGLIFGESFAADGFVSTARESYSKKTVEKHIVKRDANASNVGFASPGASMDFSTRKNVVDPSLKTAFETSARDALASCVKAKSIKSQVVSQVDCSILGAKFVGETEATAAARLGPVWRKPEVALGYSSFKNAVNPITHQALSVASAFDHPNLASTKAKISIDCVAKKANRNL